MLWVGASYILTQTHIYISSLYDITYMYVQLETNNSLYKMIKLTFIYILYILYVKYVYDAAQSIKLINNFSH